MPAIRRILIMGGGSSGWMTAALLDRLPGLEITLIEASDIPIIGVGESTNAIMRHFHRIVGVDEKSFMRGSNAAFKLAIRFEHFDQLGGAFFHPFGEALDKEACLFRRDAQAQHPTWHLARRHNRFAKPYAHAYQLDAGLYGEYLKGRCKRQGVRHIVDRVSGVELTPQGEIARVHTAQSGALTADLYIDCSGFRAFLLDKTLHEPFHSVRKFLLNDRAIAARVPYIDKASELKTYTNCVALSAGWVWEIPLWSRLGTGYVYSSAFLSPTEAEAEYREYLGVERVADLTFNHIEIRAGRHERAWIGNCVGIGVSYGFLEPLESTGLSLTQTAIIDLATTIAAGVTPEARDRFNHRQGEMFDTTRDFVVAHFALTRRGDTPYWRCIRDECERPDSLLEVLDHAARGSYRPLSARRHTFYETMNWNVILSGMGMFDSAPTGGASLTIDVEDIHADILEDTIYVGDYTEPPSVHARGPMAHPIWAPTW